MYAAIRAIEYHLPTRPLTNQELSGEFPDWPPDKIAGKLGIVERRLAAPDECASDLAVTAAQKLFASGVCRPNQIDYVLLCTQSPDYFLPTTACLVQERLGLPTSCGALDFNLGCSGFVYGLGLAKGLIETDQAGNVLLLTAETYSKFLHPRDWSVRAIFGDGAAATLVQARTAPPRVGHSWIGPFQYGTDGRGAENLIVSGGGMRQASPGDGTKQLRMNGPEIFGFTLNAVPAAVAAVLERGGRTIDDVDLFVFHQANGYMLEHLRDKLSLPPEKFLLAMSHCGNTVSSTIPIALHEAVASGQLVEGMSLLLVGFGVGYSWGSVLMQW